MRIFVLLLISVLPNMLFGQIDTLDSFFNVLPTEFYDNVYLLDNYTNANDYEQVEIVYDGGVYIFELNQQYVGVSLLNIDSQLSFGFYENSLVVPLTYKPYIELKRYQLLIQWMVKAKIEKRALHRTI